MVPEIAVPQKYSALAHTSAGTRQVTTLTAVHDTGQRCYNPFMIESTREMIWRRVVEPERSTLPRAQAKAVLGMQFSSRDLTRMRQLAARSNNGTLTERQRSELEDYVQIGHMLTLLHSKARLTLAGRTSKKQRSVRRRVS